MERLKLTEIDGKFGCYGIREIETFSRFQLVFELIGSGLGLGFLM